MNTLCVYNLWALLCFKTEQARAAYYREVDKRFDEGSVRMWSCGCPCMWFVLADYGTGWRHDIDMDSFDNQRSSHEMDKE